MVKFTDTSGDAVEGGPCGGAYMLECFSIGEEDCGVDYQPVLLDSAMARALAADLIAFADLVEKEEEA